MKKLLQLTLLTLVVTGGLVACQKSEDTATENATLDKSAKAVIKTVHGNIVFKFFPDKAPNTVTRIQQLIKEGFYDGLIFHRVIPNFVIQGGDPEGKGTGGSGQKLKAEFNDLKHESGTVAMARSSDPDSADSQFYICLGPQPHLDGKYTIFGQVIEGGELLPKIQKGDKMISVSLK